MRIVLGTRNPGKIREILELVSPLGITVEGLDAYPEAIEVVEDGDTFEANAAKKAIEQAIHLQRWVLAEDSGLSVDALNGAPGVYSARYSQLDANGNLTETNEDGNADDEANNDRLLSDLRDVPLEQRTAHYVCCAILADPMGNIRAKSQATCDGRIAFERSGSNGFGYDPLFEVIEYQQTFGVLDSSIKKELSHRGKAIRQLVPQLEKLIAENELDES